MNPVTLTVVLAALVFMFTGTAAAERSKSPADATVFIRLVGNVHVEVEEFGIKRAADRDHVEIGTGSGFVISPYGYVLTNAHVVSDDQLVLASGTRTVKVAVKVSKIEVCFPPDAADGRGPSTACIEASVYMSDSSLDLAVLFISAANLPYVALGDSDAVTAGQPINALGYPFGRQLEVGQAVTAPDLVPTISTTPGTIAATRAGDAGERRYLQISTNVNAGNSGGPVVDRDGFAVGVIRMKMADAAGIAFAIAINQVKDFLELRGLGHLMPARRMRLGPFQMIEGKGVGLRLPEGLTDTSRFRSRLETDPSSSDIALRIDRVLSPWSAKQIEQVLVGTQSFEPLATAASESQISPRPDGTRLLTGRAAGTAFNGSEEIRMDYAILDLGAEKLVARYIGPAPQVAFNAALLRESLIGVEGQPIVGTDLERVETLRWIVAPATDGKSRVPVPGGWVVEPGAPSSCTGLPPASAVIAAVAPRDFTVNVRAAVWSAAEFAPEQAAAMCSPGRHRAPSASYASRAEWLGVPFLMEGTFIRTGPGQITQLEVMAPDQKGAFVHALLATWIKTIPSAPYP